MLLKGRKVDLIKAEGTLVSPTQIRAGSETVEAKAVIVATGSKVGVPPIKGLADAKPLALKPTAELVELIQPVRCSRGRIRPRPQPRPTPAANGARVGFRRVWVANG